jgi:hypothetical protein
MFLLTVVDHVRLDSEQIAQNYTVHADAAQRMVSFVFAGRMAIAFLLLAATLAAIASLLFVGRAYQIGAVVATATALLAFALYAMFGLEARLVAHRSFAHRLWLIAERYRALLSEVHEGIVDAPALLQRRDELIRDVHAIYEFGFGVDQAGHEALRLPELLDQHAA